VHQNVSLPYIFVRACLESGEYELEENSYWERKEREKKWKA
jgi:hypothetical protein